MSDLFDDPQRDEALARLRIRAETYHAELSKKKISLICLRQVLADHYDDPNWLRAGLKSSNDLFEECAVLLDRLLRK